jgi:putative DNA primase/helicase
VCIDVDPRNGGSDTLARLEREHGYLSAGIVADTGGGGTHHFFIVPSDCIRLPSKSSLGKGIDVLHGNAYPVLPPSAHASGNPYRWASGSDPWEWAGLASPLPDWMLRLSAQHTDQPALTVSEDEDWTGDIGTAKPFDWTPENVARLRSALKTIPADERETWLCVGAALHQASKGVDEGRELWDAWSFGSDDFKGCAQSFDAADQEKTWTGFNSERINLVTVGSIFYNAKTRGWIEAANENSEPDTLGDISNGRRFAAEYIDKFLFIRGTGKWLRWDGLRWASCESGEEMQAAKELADRLLGEAVQAFTRKPDDGNNKRRHALALGVHRSLQRVQTMLEAASTEFGMNVPTPTDLNRHPMMLGVQNGVVDLRSGRLIAAEPAQRISNQAGAPYLPGAKCPRWEKFLLAVFGSADVVSFVQRLVGYTLTGLVDEEILIFMFGTGANGKSVFSNVLTALLGDYAVAVGTELLSRNKNSNEAARIKTKLQSSRLALANEVGQADTWDDQRIKEITSREHIPARLLYKEAYSFMPTHTLWVRGNHQPTILDASHGMWRRLILLPFSKQFAPDEQIPDLDRQIISQELSGILAWAVRGCLEWQRRGLEIPASIACATQIYRDESDVIGQWREERTEASPGGRMTPADAFRDWRGFAQDMGLAPGSQPLFTRRLIAAGCHYKKSNGVGAFRDLTLRQPTPKGYDDDDDDL